MRFALALMVVMLITGCSVTSPIPLDNETGEKPPAQADPNPGPTKTGPIPLELGPAPTTTAEPASPTPTRLQAKMSSLPNLGPAPELSNEVWLNTDKPLRLEELRGKVVLIDMWTFG